MSLQLGGFTSGKADIRVGSLKCYDIQILDKHCNLTIPGTGDVQETSVREDLTVNDTLEVCGALRGKNNKLTFTGDTAITGKMFCPNDEFSAIATFGGNANVCIEILDMLDPTSIMIEQCPCSGIIENVNVITGNVKYCPNRNPPFIDVYRYSGRDECGVKHNVTQYVCQQTVISPPYINNGCISEEATQVFKFPITDYAMVGSEPLDLSSVVIVQYLTDPTNFFLCPDVLGASFSGPDGGTSVTVDGAGIVCVTFPDDFHAAEIMLTIADINGLVSNIGTIYVATAGE